MDVDAGYAALERLCCADRLAVPGRAPSGPDALSDKQLCVQAFEAFGDPLYTPIPLLRCCGDVSLSSAAGTLMALSSFMVESKPCNPPSTAREFHDRLDEAIRKTGLHMVHLTQFVDCVRVPYVYTLHALTEAQVAKDCGLVASIYEWDGEMCVHRAEDYPYSDFMANHVFDKLCDTLATTTMIRFLHGNFVGTCLASYRNGKEPYVSLLGQFRFARGYAGANYFRGWHSDENQAVRNASIFHKELKKFYGKCFGHVFHTKNV